MQWAKPENASVFDPLWQQVARRIINAGSSLPINPNPLAMVTDPLSSMLGLAAGLDIPSSGVSPLKGLYSRLTRAFQGTPETMPVAKAASLAKNAASADETSWRGLPDFLKQVQGGKVSREAVLSHLEQNPIELGVKTRTAAPLPADSSYDDMRTIYNSHVLPGALPDTYRETLIKLLQPEQGSARPSYIPPHFEGEPDLLVHVRHNERILPGQMPADALRHTTPMDFGKKGRFLEEVQSDWHQEGKEKGYQQTGLPAGYRVHDQGTAPTIDPHDIYATQMGDFSGNPPRWYGLSHAVPHYEGPAANTQQEAIERAIQDLRNLGLTRYQVIDSLGNIAARGATPAEAIREALRAHQAAGVPNAPFKESWPDLALKQQLLEVAKRPDLDWLGITSGNTQNDRYNLAKRVSEIQYDPAWGRLRALDHFGDPAITETRVSADQLPRYIGQDLSKKLLASSPVDPQGRLHLTGQDLEVGGEGMRHFYDKLLPSRLEKLIKPLGGTVEKAELPGQTVQPEYFLNSPASLRGLQDRPAPTIHDNHTTQPIASIWPKAIERMKPQSGGYYHAALRDISWPLIDLLEKQNTKQGPPTPIWKANITPEMKSKILKDGFPMLTALLAGRLLASHPSTQTPSTDK